MVRETSVIFNHLSWLTVQDFINCSWYESFRSYNMQVDFSEGSIGQGHVTTLHGAEKSQCYGLGHHGIRWDSKEFWVISPTINGTCPLLNQGSTPGKYHKILSEENGREFVGELECNDKSCIHNTIWLFIRKRMIVVTQGICVLLL